MVHSRETLERLYDSPWLATFAVAALAIAGFTMWLRRTSRTSTTFLGAFMALFTIEILGDALRSGTWSPLHLLSSPWEDPIGMGFVLAGDFRFFLLVERFACDPQVDARGATRPKAWAAAIGWTFIVPVLIYVLQHAMPGRIEGRWSYLVYELLFLVLVISQRIFMLPKRLASVPTPTKKWLLDTTHYELAQYGLWALSDVIIFLGEGGGFVLRLVPNIMYYGLFLCFVGFRAPAAVER